jgi:hypothetical protein
MTRRDAAPTLLTPIGDATTIRVRLGTSGARRTREEPEVLFVIS